MRFIMVDRIDEIRPGEYARGMKLVSEPVPSTLVVEALAQLGAWLLMASTDFRQRPVLGSIREVAVHGETPRGSVVTLEAWVDGLMEDSALMHGVARIGDDPLVEVHDLLAPLVEAQTLEPVEQTRRMFTWLLRGPAR